MQKTAHIEERNFNTTFSLTLLKPLHKKCLQFCLGVVTPDRRMLK